MLADTFLMLTGSGRLDDAPVPPTLRELYLTVWNFTVLMSDSINSALPIEGDFKTHLKAFDIQADFPTPWFWPGLLSKLPPEESLKRHYLPWPTYDSSVSGVAGPTFKVPDVAKFAHADRRNQDGLVIHARMGCTHQSPDFFDVIRYNFSANAAKGYAVIEGRWWTDSPNDWVCRLKFHDGFTLRTTPDFVVPLDSNNVITDLRLVFYPNKIEARLDQPGTLVAEVPIDRPIVLYEGAHLGFGSEDSSTDPDSIKFMDWLSIYHGSF